MRSSDEIVGAYLPGKNYEFVAAAQRSARVHGALRGSLGGHLSLFIHGLTLSYAHIQLSLPGPYSALR